jgi:flagellar operon protein
MSQEWMFGVRQPLPVKGYPVHSNGKQAERSGAFQAELNKQLRQTEVIVSQHAKQRLEKRHIRLDDSELQRIGDAIDRVAAKGGKESLILYKDTAFVVNVKNRTIITAVDSQSMRENVFTNIDSALIL